MTMSKKPRQTLTERLKPFVAPFRFDGSGKFHLKSCKTSEKGGLDKEEGEKILEANRERLSELQEKLYAQDSWSLLVIFQGARQIDLEIVKFDVRRDACPDEPGRWVVVTDRSFPVRGLPVVAALVFSCQTTLLNPVDSAVSATSVEAFDVIFP